MPKENFKLDGDRLRWCCDREWLQFETTAQVEPQRGVVGQDDAMDALRFGLEIVGDGQNIFIRGLTGTGRMSLVHQLLAEVRPSRAPAPDRCYVHNFKQPDRPALVSLPTGQARTFQNQMEDLIEFIAQPLGAALSSEATRAKQASLDDALNRSVRDLGRPFEDELRANDLALVPLQVGTMVQPTLLPLIDGKPTALHELELLRADGKLDDTEIEVIHEKMSQFARRLSDVNHKVGEVQSDYQLAVTRLYEEEVRALLKERIDSILAKFPQEAVREFLIAVVDDLVHNRLSNLDDAPQFTHRYKVNALRCGEGTDEACSIVIENTPTLGNLLGSIERELTSGGAVMRSDHMMVRGGSMLRADGGYLVLEAREILSEPGAWRTLMRTLRSGKLEIVPSEVAMFWTGPLLKPDPIDLDVKVILIGDPGLYQMLDTADPDFPHLFKVLADFETSIERDRTGVNYYAGVIARIAREESHPPYSCGAVSALAEHGARIAGRRNRLTTRFGRLADIAREAAYLTSKASESCIEAHHVLEAIRRGRHRANLPARQFRKYVQDGTLRIQTTGKVVGQINGLAVVQAGQLTYGFPTRITATIGPGSAGAVNIEREAELSGAIHTKGFYILGGLLRHLLRTEHPLAFSASIAFEQSYGGIDGDSASGAEMCCLVSALTETPLDQGLAMTGAIDQHGHIQAIGAVSEKIEGFFDVCRNQPLTTSQGVIIPASNVGDLMLHQEVVDAVDAGQFSIYAVETIFDALEVLSGQIVPERGADGLYPSGTLLERAEQRAHDFWQMASAAPPVPTSEKPK